MRDVWVTRGHVRLFAREGGEGPALVFLHGGLADHRAVLPLVGSLTDRYRVILPDLRGSGRSHFSGALTFDDLARDLLHLLDALGVAGTLMGGISSGSGPAVRFAIQFPERTIGLIAVHPVYAGRKHGYTDHQRKAFGAMDAVASRAVEEGIEVLKPLFFGRLPEGMRERAWQLAAEFDPGSVAATSRFIAAGAQPFDSPGDLASIRAPTLVLGGNDEVHPAEVSALYADHIEDCTFEPSSDQDPGPVIRRFCGRVG